MTPWLRWLSRHGGLALVSSPAAGRRPSERGGRLGHPAPQPQRSLTGGTAGSQRAAGLGRGDWAEPGAPPPPPAGLGAAGGGARAPAALVPPGCPRFAAGDGEPWCEGGERQPGRGARAAFGRPRGEEHPRSSLSGSCASTEVQRGAPGLQVVPQPLSLTPSSAPFRNDLWLWVRSPKSPLLHAEQPQFRQPFLTAISLLSTLAGCPGLSCTGDAELDKVHNTKKTLLTAPTQLKHGADGLPGHTARDSSPPTP